ncbi:hypothetical protein FOMPIDRAFT_1134358 [Fomitopsis schrenkii]|uniref:DUF6534 domain-containing protein n=1 Tax=Fomitopsis schrenkii TaxID=2126942 RepID=S8DP89_FOMSC|nr:hypothetical protein FOMPIDRAFT_1134358 [Fomitopsis schrenkii]
MRNPAVKGLLSSWLITGVAADVLIAVSLVWHLVGRKQYPPLYAQTNASRASQHRRKSGFSDTDSLVNRIILLTVQTGVLTTTWAITDLALCLGLTTDSLSHEFFNFSLAKWYTIFLMSSLNNRGSWEPNRSTTSTFSWKVVSLRSMRTAEIQVPMQVSPYCRSDQAPTDMFRHSNR